MRCFLMSRHQNPTEGRQEYLDFLDTYTLVKSAEFTATLKSMNFVAVGTGMPDIARRLETEFRACNIVGSDRISFAPICGVANGQE